MKLLREEEEGEGKDGGGVRNRGNEPKNDKTKNIIASNTQDRDRVIVATVVGKRCPYYHNTDLQEERTGPPMGLRMDV